jgi:hypothetical protein
MSKWRCVKRAAGSVKSPTGVTVWRETLERWQAWPACAHVRQSFWTPGHAKRCVTSFADDLVPRCDRSWTDWNTWRRKGAGTYGRGFPVDVSQYVETVVPGVCFSSRRSMFDAISVGSSMSVSCDEGLCDMSHYKLLCVCSRRKPRLRLRGSHP